MSLSDLPAPFIYSFPKGLAFLTELWKAWALPAELQKVLALPAALTEDLGHAFQKGQTFTDFEHFWPWQKLQKYREGDL